MPSSKQYGPALQFEKVPQIRHRKEYEKRKPENLFYPREMGKLGERLFGIYMTYIKDNTDISYSELPRIHFSSINGTTMKNLSFNKYLYYICPPGTKRRAFLRKLKK